MRRQSLTQSVNMAIEFNATLILHNLNVWTNVTEHVSHALQNMFKSKGFCLNT